MGPDYLPGYKGAYWAWQGICNWASVHIFDMAEDMKAHMKDETKSPDVFSRLEKEKKHQMR